MATSTLRAFALAGAQGKVIEADPGRAFAFECSMFDFHFSTWGYRIEPTETGSRVTEWTRDLRPESVMEMSKEMSGVDDRDARNLRHRDSGEQERVKIEDLQDYLATRLVGC